MDIFMPANFSAMLTFKEVKDISKMEHESHVKSQIFSQYKRISELTTVFISLMVLLNHHKQSHY